MNATVGLQAVWVPPSTQQAASPVMLLESVCQSPPPGEAGSPKGVHYLWQAVGVGIRAAVQFRVLPAVWPNQSFNRTHCGVPPFAPPFHFGANASTPQCAG